jgi:hypothetical protein
MQEKTAFHQARNGSIQKGCPRQEEEPEFVC